MQIATFTLSPSLPLVKPQRPSNPTYAARFDPNHIVLSLKAYDLSRSNNGGVYAFLPRRSWLLCSASSSLLPNFKFPPWSELPSMSSDHRREGIQVRASSVPESVGENAGSGWGRTLELGLLFGLWYLFNIYNNLYKAKVLARVRTPKDEACETSITATSPAALAFLMYMPIKLFLLISHRERETKKKVVSSR